MTIQIQTRLCRFSEAEYHGDPVPVSLSSSIANVLDKESPAHAYARHPRLGGDAVREDSKALDAGSLAHRLLLGAGKEIEVIVANDWKTKAAQDARDIAREEGRIPVLDRVFQSAKMTAEILTARFADLGIVLDGESEISALWGEDSTSGPVQCRGMLDHWKESVSTVYDLKSCRSASLTSIQRSADGYGYDIQRAAYTSALEKIFPHLVGRIGFVFIFFELSPPYAVTPVRLSGAFRELGQRRWKSAVERWARCLETKFWPSYVDGITDLDPPAWALTRDLEKQMATRHFITDDLDAVFGG